MEQLKRLQELHRLRSVPRATEVLPFGGLNIDQMETQPLHFGSPMVPGTPYDSELGDVQAGDILIFFAPKLRELKLYVLGSGIPTTS